MRTELDNSDSLRWQTISLGDDEDNIVEVHTVPLFGPKHRLAWHCWCHPKVDGPLVAHQVAQ